MSQLPWVLLATGIAAVAFQLLTWGVSLRLGRVSIVDVTWGPSFALIAVVGFFASTGSGDTPRRVALVVLTAIWGLRLGGHIGRRQLGTPRGPAGEDPRYTELLSKSTASPAVASLTKVFLLQAVLAWVISLPVQIGLVDGGSLLGAEGFGLLAILGVLVWAVGFCFEAVGDHQLQQFRDDPSTKGTVMDRGLWHYTRHPNYFGDACVWWGLFLVSADAGWALLAVPSTLLMTWFLAAKTGKPLMEKQLSSSRKGYAEYVQRTSGFVPWFPRGERPGGS